jgi:hypothetical protein
VTEDPHQPDDLDVPAKDAEIVTGGSGKPSAEPQPRASGIVAPDFAKLRPLVDPLDRDGDIVP